GGACACIHSGGIHQSVDVDFVLAGDIAQDQLDRAMRSVGFTRRRDRYIHSDHEIFVEFPRGPLAIGDDSKIRPARISKGRATALLLSPTDSCRDRLAAFYHWNDRQSLNVAVEIARRHRVNLAKIRRWSRNEEAADKFEEFLATLKSKR